MSPQPNLLKTSCIRVHNRHCDSCTTITGLASGDRICHLYGPINPKKAGSLSALCLMTLTPDAPATLNVPSSVAPIELSCCMSCGDGRIAVTATVWFSFGCTANHGTSLDPR